MAQFLCRVMTKDGQVIEEKFNAESRADLLFSFRNRGYQPIKIEEEVSGLADISLGAKKLRLASLILFCRQTSVLLRSGIPLVKCFDILSSQSEDKLLKKTLAILSGDVQAGMVMSAAMEKQGDMFPEMLIKMVEVGEATGDLTQIMERMATQYESDSRIKRKVKGALTYPIVLIGVALVACVFMLVAVVPSFVEIFESLDQELPLLTQILLACSDFIIHRWYILLVAAPVIVAGVIHLLRTEKAVRLADRLKLRLKLLRGPVQKIICAQLARTLYTLISSGVPIIQALDYTNRNIKNTLANDAMEQVVVGVQQGKGISSQLEQYPSVFPNLLVSMISIGEASGNLEDMLSRTADYYDEELEAAITQLTTLLEPLMIVIVGLLIGMIVMALYMPMFSMISAMGGSM